MKETVTTINNFLQTLEKGTIVAMDGYSGIGKTTISNKIGEINKTVQVLHLDDYVVTSNTKESLEPQQILNNKDLKLEWSNVKGKGFKKLQEDIKNNADKTILVEGVFFSHPDVLPKTFDRLIFIDGDEGLADKRRVLREKERWGNEYFPETHPDSFARLFTLAWKKYKELYDPKNNSDLTICVE